MVLLSNIKIKITPSILFKILHQKGLIIQDFVENAYYCYKRNVMTSLVVALVFFSLIQSNRKLTIFKSLVEIITKSKDWKLKSDCSCKNEDTHIIARALIRIRDSC